EYPEFTRPRALPDGFNPSDHVETRVARLYYFRDAHRVAQIINREARSYNRAAVDVRRQLADKSRRVADQATDDRRRQERAAVQAAQATRQTEHALRFEQARLAQARSQQQQSQQQIDDLNARISGLPADDQRVPDLQKQRELAQSTLNSAKE